MGRRVGAKAVILLSGGMDSAVTAALARSRGRRCAGLALDYGQRHRHELAQARWQAKRLGLERFQTVKAPLGGLASGALVDGSRVNQGGLKAGRPGTYVSFRNGILLALAASLAEAWGADEVWGGWCFSDQGGYPDCRPAFFRAFERSVSAGTWAGRRGRRLRIHAPLGRMPKAGILRLGVALGVDFRHTWTCYAPLSAPLRPCRRCDACRLRAQGFARAGFDDPLLKRRP
jgi:7-cyano-7-deazaguanine synthase